MPGADGSIAVTPGSGATLKTYVPTTGAVVQYVSELDASGISRNTWTLSLTGTTTQIAADVQRTNVTLVNMGNGRVFIKFEAAAPTVTDFDWYLDPGDRWVVPEGLCKLAINFIASGVGGILNYTLYTFV